MVDRRFRRGRREAATRAKVITWAKVNDLRHIRMSMRPGVRQGTPDDMFLVPRYLTETLDDHGCNPSTFPCAVMVFIEFKSENSYPTAIQYARIQELKDDGFFADWFDDPDKAIDFLKEALDAVTLYGASGKPFDEQISRWASSAARRTKDLYNPRGVSPAEGSGTCENHARRRPVARRPPDMD